MDEDPEISIPIQQLEDHINKLYHKNGELEDDGFDAEYNYIEQTSERYLCTADLGKLFESALLPINRMKNRYSNILPPESDRVQLHPRNGDSDYINASFVDGNIEGTERMYIATQGPLQNTFDDFWGMVWEHRCMVIVMLTKEVENLKVKCNRYWPDELDTPVAYGHITVTLEKTLKEFEITVRIFIIRNDETGEERSITQYQYISWPDHGLPAQTSEFLHLIKSAVAADKNLSPIVVHCSAGVGRSGTFCAVHSILEEFKQTYTSIKNKTNTGNKKLLFEIPKTISKMRQQRPGMVQTKEQYMFCYLSVLEGVNNFIKELHDKKLKPEEPDSKVNEVTKEESVLVENQTEPDETQQEETHTGQDIHQQDSQPANQPANSQTPTSSQQESQPESPQMEESKLNQEELIVH